MSDRTIAITGATGFVGGRLAERLLIPGDGRHEVVAPVRRFSGAGLARLARLPVRLERAGLLDGTSLRDAFRGCDAVVHCAYGTAGTPEERRRVTVEGTENVLGAAAEAGVGRVVHLSTSVVHEDPSGDEPVDESSPFRSAGSPYEEMKLEAERAVWRAAEEGLPVVVLRPTLVYGPHGRRWTERIVREIGKGSILPDGGTCPANLIYVDHLVDAILAALEVPEAVGEGFLLVDDGPPTWRELHEAYARYLPDAPPLRDMSSDEIRRRRRIEEPGLLRGSVVEPLRAVPMAARAALGRPEVRAQLKKVPWARGIARGLPVRVKDGFREERKGAPGGGASGGAGAAEPGGNPGSYPLPDRDMVDLYTSGITYDNRKAKEILGFESRLSFQQTMERVGAWLRYQRLA